MRDVVVPDFPHQGDIRMEALGEQLEHGPELLLRVPRGVDADRIGFGGIDPAHHVLNEVEVDVDLVLVEAGQSRPPHLLDRVPAPVEPIRTLFEPGVIGRGVGDDEIEHHLQPVLVRDLEKPPDHLPAAIAA